MLTAGDHAPVVLGRGAFAGPESPAVALRMGEPRIQARCGRRRSIAIDIRTPPRYVLVVIASAVMLGLTACSSAPGDVATSTHAHPASFLNAPVTGFGGYDASGPVRSVSADWLVPRITGGPLDAHASTWIGVQDPEGDFIQIGTTEDESIGITRYDAFWSDPVVGFHPQSILSVRPGDEITAHLAKGMHGWSGTLDDLTTGKSSSVPASVHYAANAAMQQSEWVQEDAATGDGAVDAPYPNMTPTTFTALQVNDEAPVLTFSDATALASPNGVVLVPGAVENDSFTMQRGTSPQGEYLRDIAAFDSAINQFDDPRVVEGGTTAAHGRALMAAIATFDSRLSTQRWPNASQPDIRNLEKHNQLLLADLQAWEAAGDSNRLLARFTADAHRDRLLSNPVRSDLALPPI
jgi:hypothetical protein